MQITFDKPPINEVAIGAVFLPRPDLLLPSFGSFREQIRDEYPRVSHAAPVVEPNGSMVLDPFTGAPLPRVWYLSDDGGMLLQLQSDRIYSNWRNIEGGCAYPRFDEVCRRFRESKNKLDSLLIAETGIGLTILRYEVIYINVIPTRPGVRFEDIFKYFGFHGEEDSGKILGRPASRNLIADYKPKDFDGRLSVRIDSGKNMRTGEDVIRFEISTSSEAGGGSEGEGWLYAAHSLVISAFKELTTTSMQKNVWMEQE